jgi:hypothetical protein
MMPAGSYAQSGSAQAKKEKPELLNVHRIEIGLHQTDRLTNLK